MASKEDIREVAFKDVDKFLREKGHNELADELKNEVANPIKRIKYYLHSHKDYNYDLAEELGMDDSAAKTFSYCCYEICLELDVNVKTGEYTIVSFKE